MASPFVEPIRWTSAELDRRIDESMEAFRVVRFEEPLELYAEYFDEYHRAYGDLAELTVDFTDLRANAAEIVCDPTLLHVLRFLGGPPISVDDLKTITGASLAPSTVKAHPERAVVIVDTILAALDRDRFQWVTQDREPQPCEKEAAAVACASLMATEKIRTLRRSQAKALQEALVAKSLRDAGFVEVDSPRVIHFLEDAPGPGEFCRERTFGGRKADLVVGLWDRRRMPLECKVSNSSVNSYKRVNNDAAVKAVTWLSEFGHGKVVPAAVLSGVFKRANLEDAQARGLTLLWAHRLDDLLDWIARTRP